MYSKMFVQLLLLATLVCAAMSEDAAKPLPVRRPENIRYARYADPDDNVLKVPAAGPPPKISDDSSKNIRGARLHVASGAYPVFYTQGRSNGRFGAKIYTLT